MGLRGRDVNEIERARISMMARSSQAPSIGRIQMRKTNTSPNHHFRLATRGRSIHMVELRMGAVTWGLRPSPRFPSPLIKPDEPISGIRLSDWLHRKARDGAVRGRRWRHRTPSSR